MRPGDTVFVVEKLSSEGNISVSCGVVKKVGDGWVRVIHSRDNGKNITWVHGRGNVYTSFVKALTAAGEAVHREYTERKKRLDQHYLVQLATLRQQGDNYLRTHRELGGTKMVVPRPEWKYRAGEWTSGPWVIHCNRDGMFVVNNERIDTLRDVFDTLANAKRFYEEYV